MNDGWEWNSAPGNATRRPAGTNSRLPTISQPSCKHKIPKLRQQDVQSKEIPIFVDDDVTSDRGLRGDFRGKKEAVGGIAADPRYLHISLPANTTRSIPVETTRHTCEF